MPSSHYHNSSTSIPTDQADFTDPPSIPSSPPSTPPLRPSIEIDRDRFFAFFYIYFLFFFPFIHTQSATAGLANHVGSVRGVGTVLVVGGLDRKRGAFSTDFLDLKEGEEKKGHTLRNICPLFSDAFPFFLLFLSSYFFSTLMLLPA